MAGHSPSGFSGREQNSWFHQLRQVVQVLKQQSSPDHHTTTTMFGCRYDVHFLKCCVSFTPDVTGRTPSKTFHFCLVSPQNIFPKVLGIIKMFLANVRRAFVFFLVSSGFRLGTLPWMPFLPSLFLIVES
ncbi:hypothetical protein LDENG_00000080 [Lucifuga dentata]|nr:hypothetical protein LDENG_00000080 [Lucifuga dentata]